MGGLGSVPVRPERPDGRPLVVAHRGASHDRIENTAEAFVEARVQGADWVELDVRLVAATNRASVRSTSRPPTRVNSFS